ncbi:MAG: RluA family pseudouridine synthase [Bryobacteraceae bacterium]|nr:RluA family pseudouridine synthase [Bryobacteraceae bacterium]MCX7602608.1 RluA family pseudouridine synthase [Bryobacteraceae bacterium]
MAVFTVQPEEAGRRLDHFLAAKMPEHSRSRIQAWIEEGRVRVNGAVKKASWKLRAGETVEAEPAAPPPLRAFPEEIPLEVLYEDEAVAAIHKPAGLVVHAGAGRASGTLVNALLARYGRLSEAGDPLRPGIVHRLDKGTSGVILVARTDAAHRSLAAQFAARTVEKVYLALVEGRVEPDRGVIDRPIERDPVRRTRMTARTGRGRAAHTEYRVLERYSRHTLLEVRIRTGRTHQIRVHLASIGHPVAGDTLYGAAARPSGLEPLGRPWLHAWRIGFFSPATGQRVVVEAPLPPELERWQRQLASANNGGRK